MQEFPLTKQNRIVLARVFATVPEVDISIRCIIEDQMGKAFVDSADNPASFMVEQDGFFVYFAGELTSDKGKAFLSSISGGRMLMAGSEGWHDGLPDIYGDRLMPITRYSFSSDKLSIDHLQSLAENNPQTANIQEITVEHTEMDFPYLEIGAFDSAEDFVKRGIGFCMLDKGKIVGVAYSSLVCSGAIEISIFVEDNFRRKGVATALSCQLLLWCLERKIEPHWDAANPESCKLATKLGYTDQSDYRAYFLKATG